LSHHLGYDGVRRQGPSPRRGRVRRAGIVVVTAATCACGRPVEPLDFAAVNSSVVRAICPACHRDLVQFERTWREDDAAS
jgi:hypothetical protein